MSADKFLNSSTLGNAGTFPFEKLTPWGGSSFEAPDWIEWEQGDREELDRFVNGHFALMRPPRPVFEKLEEFIEADGDDKNEGTAHLRTLFRQSHRFLMTHDWAGAFAGDRDFDDRGSEFRLPAPNCCFDFYDVSGRHLLALISERAISANGSLTPVDGTDGTDYFLLAVQLKSRNWMLFGQGRPNVLDGEARLFAFILRNIKAACIALEAEIAETEIVRAPHKLNRARIKRGKLPLSDYHIINLARRSRVAPLLDGETAERNGPRLHFRRGHWRHFVSHKTWIKWTLVGDPDLGFIDKDYRL
jgi:hypothetical protein